MKRLIFLFAVSVFVLFCGFAKTLRQDDESEEPEAVSNLIKNGGFSEGKKFWDIFLSNGSADQLITQDGEMEIRIRNPGPYEYAIQPYFDGFSLYRGGVYKYSFDVHSSVERTFEWRLQVNGRDYHAYAGGWESIGTEKKHIEAVFTMREPTDFSPRLVLNVGKGKGCPDDLKAHSVFFDNFSLELVDASGITEIVTSRKSSNVNLNQIGYVSSSRKTAVVRSRKSAKVAGNFNVVDVNTGAVVFSGKLKNARYNEVSGEQTAVADFSALSAEGTYKIKAGKYGESFEFKISGGNMYDELLSDALRFFYLQRCGQEISDPDFAHPECHKSLAVVYGDIETKYDVSGGWHDAGDYGRYVVPAAKAACDLMLACEHNADSLDSASVLAEVKYELDWMLKMQIPETGAVFHKVSCREFPGEVPPQDETDRLVLCPVSTAATADFAAAMAMAARIFSSTSDGKKYLAAAEKAWAYLEKTPFDGKGFFNPILFTTGAYGDSQDADERFWAACELYKTTGSEKYLVLLKEYEPSDVGQGFGWQQVGLYGLYAYLSSGAPQDSFYQKARKAFIAKANEKLGNVCADSYSVSLSMYEYEWGSNMSVANNGMLFLLADRISPNKKFKEAAESQLNYLLGTNTNSYCFVTGFGTLCPILPHHRPSQVARKTMPGMLVGGPDSKLEDPFARANLSDAPYAACYIDSVQSYSCNEVTIYWNSPLVYLISGCRSFYQEL
ncbi:glycoside hydrolase family 9 protein [Treponema sp.]|uniref:glycoside hydrolase family 9 protein n=1 Tax=Treponema sp. TaxID=166 RepID=UPI003F0A4390